MTVRIRPYDHEFDFVSVLRLLSEWYEPGDHLAVWQQARWSYMHHHPNVDALDFSQFGVAVDDTGIVGIVHQEHAPAFTYLQIAPGRDDAIAPLIDWAEHHLGGWSRTLEREALGFWVGRCRTAQVSELQRRGYELTDFTEPTALFDLTDPVEPTPLPAGYRLATLADDNDLRKINQVLWRGFGHGDDAPEDEIPGRARGQRAPGFRHDRTVVVVAPNGDFVSYAGIWFDEWNRSAMVEPVATDPAHRRKGLGRAAVLETVRLAREDGATHAWVGSEQEFYVSTGFRIACTADLWLRPS
jgi:predicted N-acetyltransferase YhbS